MEYLELMKLMKIADYLKIERLLDLIGARIATNIHKWDDSAKIEYLRIPDDLTAEQKEEALRDNEKILMYINED